MKRKFVKSKLSQMKRFLVLMIACLLFCFPALALEGEEWLMPEGEAAFSMQAQVQALLPWTDTTLEMINRLLNHISLEASVTKGSARMALAVEGTETVWLEETESDAGTILQTDALPNRILSSSGSALEGLLTVASAFEEEDTLCPYTFDLSQALQEGLAAYPALKEQLAPMAESKAANYTIKNVGKGSWVLLGRLTKDQSAELHDALCAVLSAGLDSNRREMIYSLTFQKALNVAVYSTGKEGEEGEDLAVYVKGNVKHPNGKTYEISYQMAWGEGISTYKLEIGKGKKDGLAISGTLTLSGGDTSYEESLKCTSSFRSEDGKIAWEITDQQVMTGKRSKALRTLKGTLTRKEKATGDTAYTQETEWSLDLACEEGILTGSLTYGETQDKNTLTQVTMTLTGPGAGLASAESSVEPGEEVVIVLYGDEDEIAGDTLTAGEDDTGFLVGTPPAGMTAYNAPAAALQVDLDTVTPEALEALQQEMFQNTAGTTLYALFTSLPREDLALLEDNIEEETFTRWLAQFDQVEE